MNDNTKQDAGQISPELAKMMASLDLNKLGELAGKIDLASILDAASNMNDKQLKQLSRALGVGGSGKKRILPSADGDFYDYLDTLTDEQVRMAANMQEFMHTHIAPIMNEYWSKDEFPRQIIPEMAKLNLLRHIWHEDGTRKKDATIKEGLITLEASRVDVSTAVFFGVHGGLAFASLALGADEEQKKRWLPDMLDMKKIGAFGLTEPEGGSQVSEGMRTTCRREGDQWVLNGEKKWIGNSTFSDFTVIWARDEETDEVRGFYVERGTAGYRVEKIEGKIALRMVENGHIYLENCRVSDENRLRATKGWNTVSDVLRLTRSGVAWQGVGCAMGAYELALSYTQERRQFGKRIGEFQLIQNHLVLMVGEVTAMLGMVLRLSHMADEGMMEDKHASLAKVYTAARCREVVARAREVFGGNGILLEYGVAKQFADTEAIYSYEGTNEMNTLVVGRAITGLSAFV